MAPLCADPRQIVIALNPARRRALLQLFLEITWLMTQQLENKPEDLGPVAIESDFDEKFDEKSEQTEAGEKEKKTESSSETNLVDASDDKGTDEKTKSTPRPQQESKKAEEIRLASLDSIKEWREEVAIKVEEIVKVEDTDKITAERHNRVEAMEKQRKEQKPDGAEESDNLITFGDVKVDVSEDVSSLQTLYKPVPTRLTTIPIEDRREVLCCILLLLLSTGKYSAYSRTLSLWLASSLEIPQAFLNQEEAEIARSLMESGTADQSQKEAMTAEAEAAKRREDNKFSRFWKVGLASVAGATIIGVTGGLAAPLVAGALGSVLGSIGLGGVASFLGIFWMNGALVGALFGAYGGRMTGKVMDRYAKEVEDFSFIPLQDGKTDNNDGKAGDDGSIAENDDKAKEKKKKKPSKKEREEAEKENRRLRVTIGINGWLNEEEGITKPWRALNTDTEVFALRYEMKTLLSLGTALKDLVGTVAWKAFKAQIIQRTVLAALSAALWPITVISAATSIDNPFSRASNRSKKAGRLLADALINKVQGERPVTLIGYSLGATAIHACLQSLAERHAFGLVETVVIIGAPAPSAAAHWRTLRSVVSGKIFNVYSENDMILGLVYRLHSLDMGVAGLQPIQGVEGIENLDLSEKVSGHLRYPSITGEILRRCGFVGIEAGTEIEEDDVIKMKGQHADGEALDLDYGDEKGSGEVTDDLKGLSISQGSSAAHEQPPQESGITQGPGDDENGPPLPRRPTEPTSSQAEEKAPALPRRRTESESSPTRPALPTRRPHTPESNASEIDDGHTGITMADNDHDTE